jgi:hypothetical protein
MNLLQMVISTDKSILTNSTEPNYRVIHMLITISVNYCVQFSKKFICFIQLFPALTKAMNNQYFTIKSNGAFPNHPINNFKPFLDINLYNSTKIELLLISKLSRSFTFYSHIQNMFTTLSQMCTCYFTKSFTINFYTQLTPLIKDYYFSLKRYFIYSL